VDAHSMLPAEARHTEAVRLATPDSLAAYMAGQAHERTEVTWAAAIEEAHFLGLRLNRGVRASELAERYGPEAATVFREQVAELRALGLMEARDGAMRLTARGRLLSNEVFQRFLGPAEQCEPRFATGRRT
jgi:coproporphyrinogen III oxidase-like Fe-S oxidoreductase